MSFFRKSVQQQHEEAFRLSMAGLDAFARAHGLTPEERRQCEAVIHEKLSAWRKEKDAANG